MSSETRHWLLKSEPESFSIADLANSPNQTTFWDGVRNYQARNFMRDMMQVGDRVLFYHSNADPPAVVGVAQVASAAYPDHTAWDPLSPHYDPASSREDPIWHMVDVQFVETFAEPLPLDRLRLVPGLENMELLRPGSRLSVQPVTADEFRIVLGLAHGELPLPALPAAPPSAPPAPKAAPKPRAARARAKRAAKKPRAKSAMVAAKAGKRAARPKGKKKKPVAARSSARRAKPKHAKKAAAKRVKKKPGIKKKPGKRPAAKKKAASAARRKKR
jgi:predicted RNA-binding protein with PUA-like domain